MPACRPATSRASVSPWRMGLPSWTRRLCPRRDSALSHQRRSDRDAALRQTDEGLGLGQLEQGAIIGHSHARSVGGRGWSLGAMVTLGYRRRNARWSTRPRRSHPRRSSPRKPRASARWPDLPPHDFSSRGRQSLRIASEWSGRRGSNPRHAAWKAAALPTELLPHRIVLGREHN